MNENSSNAFNSGAEDIGEILKEYILYDTQNKVELPLSRLLGSSEESKKLREELLSHEELKKGDESFFVWGGRDEDKGKRYHSLNELISGIEEPPYQEFPEDLDWHVKDQHLSGWIETTLRKKYGLKGNLFTEVIQKSKNIENLIDAISWDPEIMNSVIGFCDDWDSLTNLSNYLPINLITENKVEEMRDSLSKSPIWLMTKETYKRFKKYKQGSRTKENAMIMAMTKEEEPIEITQNTKQGRLYIISGCMGSGKTEVMRRLKALDSNDLGFVVTDTTRKPREGETNDEYRDHGYKSTGFWTLNPFREKDYDVTYTLAGEQYGLSLEKVRELTKEGKDVFIISPFQGLKAIKEKIASDGNMLPPISILITAHYQNLVDRIHSREEPITQKEKRIVILKQQYEEFRRNLDEFDLIYSNPNPHGIMDRSGIDLVINQTFAALDRTRFNINRRDFEPFDIEKVKKKYVDDLITWMFDHSYGDIFTSLRNREGVYLNFSDEQLNACANSNREISDLSLERVKRNRLLLTPNSYGVISLLFEGFQDMDERKLFLDLIENIGMGKARKVNLSSQYKEYSEHGFFRIPNSSVNDGLTYCLSDDSLREDPDSGLYALNIALLQPGKSVEEMLSLNYAPLSKARIEELKREKSGTSSLLL